MNLYLRFIFIRYIQIQNITSSGICALHLTRPSAHTPGAVGNNAAAPGEQLGVQCLAPGSQLSRGIEGGENLRYSLLTPTIPAGAEIRTHNLRLQVRRSIHKAMTDIWCALHKCTLICFALIYGLLGKDNIWLRFLAMHITNLRI